MIETMARIGDVVFKLCVLVWLFLLHERVQKLEEKTK